MVREGEEFRRDGGSGPAHSVPYVCLIVPVNKTTWDRRWGMNVLELHG